MGLVGQNHTMKKFKQGGKRGKNPNYKRPNVYVV